MFTPETYLALLHITQLRAHLESIVQSELQWDAKYRLVFNSGVVQRVFEVLKPLDFALEWYDPDADYSDDVLAYMRALDDLLRKMREALKALPASEAMALFTAVTPQPAAQPA